MEEHSQTGFSKTKIQVFQTVKFQHLLPACYHTPEPASMGLVCFFESPRIFHMSSIQSPVHRASSRKSRVKCAGIPSAWPLGRGGGLENGDLGAWKGSESEHGPKIVSLSHPFHVHFHANDQLLYGRCSDKWHATKVELLDLHRTTHRTRALLTGPEIESPRLSKGTCLKL